MQTVLIVGGGASGMTAAITAAEDSQNRVILIEKQARVGKKLLSTGNGCCNLSNTDLSSDNYFGADVSFASPALNRFGLDATLAFFASLGLLTRAEESGKIYPYSLQAGSVLDVLRFAMERPNIEVRCDIVALSASRKGDGFAVETSSGRIYAAKLIIACGGAAAPKLGGTMDGYELLKLLGHSRTAIYPSLVQIKTDNTYPRALKGIKTDAMVSVLSGNQTICDSLGEILFTEYGLSGPAIFEISRFVSTEKDLSISLDLMPEHGNSDIYDLLFKRRKNAENLSCENFLTGFLNKRLGQTVLKYAGIPLALPCSSLTDDMLHKTVISIKGFQLPITGTTGFENAQVTAGGIRTSEFYSETLESRVCHNLFAAGEVLDIDGRCGGYNLQWAWSSGMLAGKLGNQ